MESLRLVPVLFELGARDPDRDRLRFGAAQLRLGLRDIGFRSYAGSILITRYPQ